MKFYKRLNIEDREEISRLLACQTPLREIARRLKRSPSTISREVMRFKRGVESYRALAAPHGKKKGKASPNWQAKVSIK